MAWKRPAVRIRVSPRPAGASVFLQPAAPARSPGGPGLMGIWRSGSASALQAEGLRFKSGYLHAGWARLLVMSCLRYAEFPHPATWMAPPLEWVGVAALTALHPLSVAQLGSASGLGPEGRRFESCHSDSRQREPVEKQVCATVVPVSRAAASSTRFRPGVRGVAQYGSAPRSGRGGRWFKSSHPD